MVVYLAVKQCKMLLRVFTEIFYHLYVPQKRKEAERNVSIYKIRDSLNMSIFV